MTTLPPNPPEHRPHVIIVANFTSDDVHSNNRFSDLARRFVARGAEVELVTSRFSHARKAMREEREDDTSYRVTRLHEPGYPRNVSLERLRSQAIFAAQVRAHLDSLDRPPHLLLAATPPPAVTYQCGRYARRHPGVAFAIDVQDLWPEAFAMVAKAPRAVDLVFTRMRRLSRSAYHDADRVVGVSRTYIDSAVAQGADPERTSVVYLGTDLAHFDDCATSPGPAMVERGGSGTDQTLTIGYAGGLSASYDLTLVIDALARLAADPARLSTPDFKVMGSGDLRGDFEAYARSRGVNVHFAGQLPYADMVRSLAACDLAVNPIVPGSAGSILNKAGDYAAAGLPVINSQESPEYRDLLERFQAGISCTPGDVDGMAAAIGRLVDDPERRRRLGVGSRRLAEELFDRAVTYEQLVDDLLEMAGGALVRD